jgi:hypothetical protein
LKQENKTTFGGEVWQKTVSGRTYGTLEEWAKKPDAEFATIEAEVREIRELLDEN